MHYVQYFATDDNSIKLKHVFKQEKDCVFFLQFIHKDIHYEGDI